MKLIFKQDEVLTDNHGRIINYARLAVTDRCNLRCSYCMPEQGLDWLSRNELMNNAELLHISRLLVHMGIRKIRITGGEPFVRKDMMPLLQDLSQLPGLEELTITTNGVLTAPLIPDLKKMGVRSVNLSLDSLDRERFFSITRRDEFPAVWDTLEQLLRHDMEVKINTVVMTQRNIADLVPLAMLTKELPVSVRFIEEMPFNGEGHSFSGALWNEQQIHAHLLTAFPGMYKIPDPPYATAHHYQVPGHRGTIGIIAAYTRNFCGSCNRLRITPQGMLKTCLYDGGVLNIRDLLRKEETDDSIREKILGRLGQRAKDGWEAEKNIRHTALQHESMASIGG